MKKKQFFLNILYKHKRKDIKIIKMCLFLIYEKKESCVTFVRELFIIVTRTSKLKIQETFILYYNKILYVIYIFRLFMM